MTVEWHANKVINAAKIVLKNVSKEVANDVMDDAKRILKQKAKTTTEKGLLSQFDVKKSKFKDGGYVVSCQGPGNYTGKYHASFVELGTPKKGVHPYGNKKIPAINQVAKPFMRPAAKKNKRSANKKYQAALDKL